MYLHVVHHVLVARVHRPLLRRGPGPGGGRGGHGGGRGLLGVVGVGVVGETNGRDVCVWWFENARRPITPVYI